MPIEHYEMKLVFIAFSHPIEYIFVVGNVAYKTVDALKEGISHFPKGSTLDWNPGCKQSGEEPLLSSEKDLESFKAFCEKAGVKLTIHPGG